MQAAAQKPNSASYQGSQPLKRCKSNSSNTAAPKQGDAAPKNKKLVKQRTMIPHQSKSSGIPPVKDPENPEVEQLPLFVDEEESEEEQTAAEDVLQEFQAS